MKTLDVIAAVLLVIGGLNWALVGAARFDLVATIFGMHFRRDISAEFRGVPASWTLGRVPGGLMEGDSAPLDQECGHRTQPLTLSGRAAGEPSSRYA
jgi:hypothetical protein